MIIKRDYMYFDSGFEYFRVEKYHFFQKHNVEIAHTQHAKYEWYYVHLM